MQTAQTDTCNTLHMASSHQTLTAATQRSCTVEGMHDLRPAFFFFSPQRRQAGIHRFMFHDMLYWRCALLSHPSLYRSSLVYTEKSNPIYLRLTTLYNSPFYSYSPSLPLLFSLSLCLSVPLLLHPSPLSPLPSSWLRRYSPCTPWQCSSCLNRTTMTLACVPSPPCSATPAGSDAPAPTWLMMR